WETPDRRAQVLGDLLEQRVVEDTALFGRKRPLTLVDLGVEAVDELRYRERACALADADDEDIVGVRLGDDGHVSLLPEGPVELAAPVLDLVREVRCLRADRQALSWGCTQHLESARERPFAGAAGVGRRVVFEGDKEEVAAAEAAERPECGLPLARRCGKPL